MTSGNYNIDSDGTALLTGPQDVVANPLIAALANNGGPTDTHALMALSPAIDPVGLTGAPAIDQRGLTRNGISADIGAYESPFVPPLLTSFSGPVETTMMDTEVEVTFAELIALGDESDADGTVDAFVVKSVATGATLRIGASVGTATAWAAGTNDTIDATNHAYWTPPAFTVGTLNAFAVVAKDNDGLESTSNVTAQITVTSGLPAWSITGDSSVTEAGERVTRSLERCGCARWFGFGRHRSDRHGTTSHWIMKPWSAAINEAIASRPDLSFDGTTLTYTASTDYTANYNPTGGGFVDISGTGTRWRLVMSKTHWPISDLDSISTARTIRNFTCTTMATSPSTVESITNTPIKTCPAGRPWWTPGDRHFLG